MSYYLYDSGGYVGDVASIGGWLDFRQATESAQPEAATLEFIEKGLTERIGQLARELKRLRLTDRSAESVGAGLVALLPRCRDIAILTDGVGGEDEDENPEGLNLEAGSPPKKARCKRKAN